MQLALPTEAEVIAKLVAWGEAEPALRALVMTSSRARPTGSVDVLSDYDVIAFVNEPERFVQTEAWQAAYGRRLVVWGDESVESGAATYFRGVIFDDFVKIDYSFWPALLLAQFAGGRGLPAELDAGYRVLLDKDGHTAGWPAPTYRGYTLTPPSAAEYLALVEEFWWTTSYVAKSLWRDELLFAHWCLDNEIRLGTLRRVLEWHVALRHGWGLRPGVLGRGLKPRLPADLWAALAATYTGPSLDDHWGALFGLVSLFRRVAQAVGAALGYVYPQQADDRMLAYLHAVRELPRNPA